MNTDTLANQFKAFSEPVRLRILYLLLEKEEICVCDLVTALNLSQSVVSRHLAYLKNNHLIESRRVGTWMHYRIKATQLNMINQLLEDFLAYARASSELQQDLVQLNHATNTCT